MRVVQLGAILLAAIIGSAVASSQAGGEKGATLSVAALVAQLETRPGPWIGHTMTLLGTLEPCPWSGPAAQTRFCAGEPLVLAAARGTGMLPAVCAAEPSWLALARDIPFVGALLPAPRALTLFTPLRVTVRVERLPASSCGMDNCFRARLLSSARVRVQA